jgi:hypothetical protein
MLDELGTRRPPKAIWVYRDYEGRVRSAVAKFGTSNLGALQDLVAGERLDSWQLQRLDDDQIELVRRLDPARMSAEEGAALFWYLRNSFFFSLGLDTRPDVTIVSYDRIVAEPLVTMSEIDAFIGVPLRALRASHVRPRPSTYRGLLALRPDVRALCEEMQERLDRAPARSVAPVAKD